MSFIIREATSADISALAHLHVETFNETHVGPFGKGPTYELRERQWRETFHVTDGSWFCFVIEHQKGDLIGFAKGQRYAHLDQPDFSGELNKIHFLSQGISSMLLFGEARNPSNGFYEALGAERLFSTAGEFHGGYGWRDLRPLASIE